MRGALRKRAAHNCLTLCLGVYMTLFYCLLFMGVGVLLFCAIVASAVCYLFSKDKSFP